MLGFIVLGWGKHHALITSVDKPSQPSVGPYPTPTPTPTPVPTPTPTNLASLPFKKKFYVVLNHSIGVIGTVRVFHSVTSDRRVQCSRVGLGVKIYDTPAGDIRASQGTFSSLLL